MERNYQAEIWNKMRTQRASVWALFSLWGIFAGGNIFALIAAASLVEIEQKSKWRAHTRDPFPIVQGPENKGEPEQGHLLAF